MRRTVQSGEIHCTLSLDIPKYSNLVQNMLVHAKRISKRWMWRCEEEKCTLNKYQAGCTTTHTTEIESIFFLQISVCEVLYYIFTRSAHAGITFSLQSIVLVLVSTFTHYHFVFVFVEPYLMRGVKFLEKLCNIGWTIFCCRCHLSPISSPVLHIWQKCSCRKSFSPGFFSWKLKPMLEYTIQEKNTLEIIWGNLLKIWTEEPGRGFLAGFFLPECWARQNPLIRGLEVQPKICKS